MVGLLELFAGHGQNRFYRELEEWLSSITRLGFATGDGDENSSTDQQFMVAVIDHLGEQMEGINQMFTASDVSRNLMDEKIGKLADAVARLTDRMEAQEPAAAALTRLADGQEALVEALEGGVSGGGIDAESRMRLRSIDVQMLRILEEIAAGRQESVAELRGDLAALTRALKERNRPPRRPRPTPSPARRAVNRSGGVILGAVATHRRAVSGLDLAGVRGCHDRAFARLDVRPDNLHGGAIHPAGDDLGTGQRA